MGLKRPWEHVLTAAASGIVIFKSREYLPPELATLIPLRSTRTVGFERPRLTINSTEDALPANDPSAC